MWHHNNQTTVERKLLFCEYGLDARGYRHLPSMNSLVIRGKQSGIQQQGVEQGGRYFNKYDCSDTWKL